MLDPIRLAVVFATLLAIGLASRTGGKKLTWALAFLAVGVGSINILIEALAFAVADLRQTATALLIDAPILAALAVMAGLIADRLVSRPDVAGVQPRRQLWRLLCVPFAYVVFYLVAGAIAFPMVADFYADKKMPGLTGLVVLQLVRGVVFMASSWAILSLRPRFASVTLGAAFSILGGLAPLMSENALMPDSVRLVHAIEVGASNFLFGAFLAWILLPKPSLAFPETLRDDSSAAEGPGG